MMNTAEILRRLEETMNRYKEELSQLSLEQLRCQPSEEEWSIGQMYLHLIRSALDMQLRNIEACRNQGEHTVDSAGKKTEAGAHVFALGSFPPIRIQVPQNAPEQPESKEQIVEGLNTVLQRMKEIAPAIEEIPRQHTAAHPRLGSLNAKEWFALLEMHYRHHLHQLERLKATVCR